MKFPPRLPLSLATLLAAAGLSAGGLAAGQARASSPAALSITNGLLQPSRQTHVPSRLAGYFVINNAGNTDQLLEGITSPYCQQVTVNHSNQEALETGDPSEDIFHHLAIPRQAKMVFPPAGYHLLCYGFRKDVPAGSAVPFVFHFLNSPDITADFTLQASAPPPAPKTP